jgi:hypothetical protein
LLIEFLAGYGSDRARLPRKLSGLEDDVAAFAPRELPQLHEEHAPTPLGLGAHAIRTTAKPYSTLRRYVFLHCHRSVHRKQSELDAAIPHTWLALLFAVHVAFP